MPPTFDSLPPATAAPPRRVVLHDWSDHLTPYQEAWDTQHRLVDAKLAAMETAPDRLLLLQHPPTYTLGTGSTSDNLLFDPADVGNAPAALFKVERGGEVRGVVEWVGFGLIGWGRLLLTD